MLRRLPRDLRKRPLPVPHLLLILLINLIWGANIVLTKLVFDELPPVLFATARFFIVFVAMAAFLRLMPGKMKLVVGTALTMGALHFTLIYLGLELADDVATVAIATQLFVPFATILSVVFLGERVGWKRATGITLAFGGMLVIGFDPVVFGYLDSLGFVALGAFVAAIGTIFMKRMGEVSVLGLQAWIAFLSWPGLLLTSFLTEYDRWPDFGDVSLTAWGILAFSAFGAGVLGHGSMYWLLQRHDVSIISPTTLLSTVFGVLFGVLFLGDHVSIRLVAGGVLALAGVFVISLRQPRRGPTPVLAQPFSPGQRHPGASRRD